MKYAVEMAGRRWHGTHTTFHNDQFRHSSKGIT
jgi:hypothetical protein